MRLARLWMAAAPVNSDGHRPTAAAILAVMTTSAAISAAIAAAEFVLTHGPLTLEQIHSLAVEREVTRARTPAALRSALSGSPRFVLRPDGRYDTAARLLAGSVFTTRPRRAPRDGVLWLNRDVDPLLALGATSLPLQAGGDIRPGVGSTPTWVGPEGWLPDVDAGGLLALRWDGKALVVSTAEDVPAADSAQAHDVRRFLAAHASARHAAAPKNPAGDSHSTHDGCALSQQWRRHFCRCDARQRRGCRDAGHGRGCGRLR